MVWNSCHGSDEKPIFHFISARCWRHRAQENRQLRSLLLQKAVEKGQEVFLRGSCFLKRNERRVSPKKAQLVQSRSTNQPLDQREKGSSREDELCVNFTIHWIVNPGRRRKLEKFQPWLILGAYQPLCFYSVLGAWHYKLALPPWACMMAQTRNSEFLTSFSNHGRQPWTCVSVRLELSWGWWLRTESAFWLTTILMWLPHFSITLAQLLQLSFSARGHTWALPLPPCSLRRTCVLELWTMPLMGLPSSNHQTGRFGRVDLRKKETH